MGKQSPSIAIIGIGNEFRSDDAIGLLVARRLGETVSPVVTAYESSGDPAEILDIFSHFCEVYIIDALYSGVDPGAPSETIVRIDAMKSTLRELRFHASSHHLGVATAIELARSLGMLPEKLVVFGIPATDFRQAERLSALLSEDTEARVARAVELVRQELSSSDQRAR